MVSYNQLGDSMKVLVSYLLLSPLVSEIFLQQIRITRCHLTNPEDLHAGECYFED